MNLTFAEMYADEENCNTLFYNEEDFKKGLEYVKMYIESYQDMTDIEKYQLLNHIFNFYYNNEDMVNLLNLIKKTKYTKLVNIPTKMEISSTNTEGHGKDFSWWTVRNHYYLVCATLDSFSLTKENYSYDELMELINNKIIYPMYFYSKKNKRKIEDKESYKEIKNFIEDEINGKLNQNLEEENVEAMDFEYIIKPNNEVIPSVLKLINKKLSNEELFSYIRYYFKDIMESIKMYQFDDLLTEYNDYYNKNFKNKRRLVKVKK